MASDHKQRAEELANQTSMVRAQALDIEAALRHVERETAERCAEIAKPKGSHPLPNAGTAPHVYWGTCEKIRGEIRSEFSLDTDAGEKGE